MGQAIVDLPDPIQSPTAPATAGTDDLLAQLAGDEIERLLAETDTERPAPVATTGIAVAAPAFDRLPSESVAPTSAPIDSSAAEAAATGDSKENLTSQLDALFESLNDAAGKPAAAATAPTIEVAPSVAPVFEAPAPSSDLASSAAELKALGQPIAPAEAHTPAPAAALATPLEAEVGPSLLVRFLELINSPLLGCSDPVRQTVGKIAIATLLNAIAVLAYTLIFRHR